MTAGTDGRQDRVARALRIVTWGGAATLLALPLVAMQFTDEVQWTPFDFGVFGAMLGLAGGGFEFLLRRGRAVSYRLAAALALGTGFLTMWINLAVGIVGSENDPINALFPGVLGIGLAAALLGRFTPAGMARAMIVTAVAQVLAAVVALAARGFYKPVIGITVVLTLSWLAAAALFRRAA